MRLGGFNGSELSESGGAARVVVSGDDGLGLGLSLPDFRSLIHAPKAILVGLLAQLVMLPVLAWVVAEALSLEPEIAVGLILISLCPGGVTSNLFSLLAKANVALSISLTACVSLITPFTIPLVLGFTMEHYLGQASDVSFPLSKTLTSLLVITLVPVGLGMLIRGRRPEFAIRMEAKVRLISTLLLFLIILGLVVQQKDNLAGFFGQSGLASLVLCVGAMATGLSAAWLARLPRPAVVTIGAEVGIQNGTTGLFLALTILQSPPLSVPAVTYALVMLPMGALYSWFFARQARRI